MNNDVCSVCLDRITDETGKVTACGHKFHILCLERWLSISGPDSTCPECRHSITSSSVKDAMVWGSTIVDRIVRGN